MRRWRKSTWAIIIWTVLVGIWLASGVAAVGDNCAGLSGDDLNLCQGATAVGAGIGTTFIFGIWFLGFIVLSVIWFASRPHRRLCPVCGNEVRKGVTKCASCGHDFAAVAA